MKLTRKSKQKPTRAIRELQADWDKLLIKWERKSMIKPTYELYQGLSYDDRGNHAIPSVGDLTGSALLKDAPTYTGTKMLGITIVHKSCLQPVFSQEEAEDAARMRR